MTEAAVHHPGGCPLCGGGLVLREAEGKWILQCGSYPVCRQHTRFPSSLMQAAVVARTCTACQSRPRSSSPAPCTRARTCARSLFAGRVRLYPCFGQSQVQVDVRIADGRSEQDFLLITNFSL